MKEIIALYKKIIAIGTADTFSDIQNKRTRLVNIYVLICLHTSMIFYVGDLIFVQKPISDHFTAYVSYIALISILVCNKKHLFDYAKIMWIAYLFVFINLSALKVNPGIYTEYYFLLIPGICLSIYQKNTIPIICTLLSIICFFIPYYFFDIYPVDHPNRIQVVVITCLFYSIYAIVNYFKKHNIANEEKLARAYKQLEETKKSEVAHLQLKSLKAQMNPHFMFNAMNSIQNLVLKGDKQEAYDYLTQFATLIRGNLNMSEKSFVYFEEELSLLKKYLELERLRFRDSLEYHIKGADTIGDIKIPSMIIQPFVENAIKHGLLHKQEGKKILELEFQQDEIFKCIITDNGVGLRASKTINKVNEANQSFSTKAIEDRLLLLKDYYKTDIGFTYENVKVGTKVILKIPYTIISD
ncbi:sensor histidine kinase [Aquimarina megaterium]|uniref:sensor histidine kinase n=1 Tax=Aquimarina megaterium TaxID=1443666 RepID=UPI000472E615|nr:histidine kinase [Aquimarina megaterium]